MNEEILHFLSKEHVCALTVLLPDGTPHAAALHFSHTSDPLTLYFSTENTSRKAKGLLLGEIVKSAVVVGLSETEWITLQMEGTTRAVTALHELESAYKVHYAKHPDSEQYKNDPDTVFLAFTPTWWRYTDYNTKPITIMSSEQS